MVENTQQNTPNISSQRGKLEGVVIQNIRQHEGTITVLVENRKPHKKYNKITTANKKYIVQYNDKHIELPVGAVVRLVQIAPKSKKKFLQIETILRIKR